MSGPAATARRQQELEELGAAALRALTGDAALHYRGRRLWRGAQPLPAFGPHLQPSLEAGDDLRSFRGAADGSALRLLHSDAALHRTLVPAEPRERWVFELLEQLRVESLVPENLPGVAANLRHRFERWSLAFHASGMTETESGLLLYAIAQGCRSRVAGEPVLAATEDLIESTRASLAPVLGPLLAGLRRDRFEQARYARHALELARAVARSLPQQQEDLRAGARSAVSFSLWFDYEPADGDPLACLASSESRVLADAQGRYRAFTTAYDAQRDASRLVRRALLEEYRAGLDGAAAALCVNVPRLARELQAVLATPEREGWDDGQEDGVLDGRRLAQLVASPGERRLFRHERFVPRADCAVAFLLDCSASMRDSIQQVALFVDTCTRAFELAGASCEVLGFTTGAWNGGRAARDWQRAGRPPHPGRLNERCHLVFKDAGTPWARGRRGIAALLKSDLLREGIDGEAVDWACERLLAVEARRRLLFVVSDGSPMDSATALANDAQYLDQHLREVVARREADGRVEVRGIGIGLDLGAWYRRSWPLNLSQGLERSSFVDFVQMLRRTAPRA